MQTPAPASPHVRLTSMREAEVLFYLWQGCTRKGAAAALGLRPKSVDTHCRRLHQRLGVDHDTGAVLWAVEHRPCCHVCYIWTPQADDIAGINAVY